MTGNSMDSVITDFLLEKRVQAFHFLDRNNDGLITVEDFTAIADHMSKKVSATEEEAARSRQEWAKWYDILQSKPESKEIGLQSFVDVVRELYKDPKWFVELNKATANDLFDKLDIDKDNKISFGELTIFYEAIGVTDLAATRDAFSHIDKDGDGFIDREELVDDFVSHFCNPDPRKGQAYLFSPVSK